VGGRRAIAYIDGFNLYNGLMSRDLGHFRWLDYGALMSAFVQDGEVLAQTKVFTSLMTHEPERLARQKLYLRAVEKRGGVEIIAGEFVRKATDCSACGQTYKRPQEKKSDVSLACHLVADAFDHKLDVVFIVSADSDLTPAVELVKQRFGVNIRLLEVPGRHSKQLVRLADTHLHVTARMLSAAQLPDPVEYAGGGKKIRRIYRPAPWADK